MKHSGDQMSAVGVTSGGQSITSADLRKLVDTTRQGTHWDGCWKYHKSCALLVAADALEAEREQALLTLRAYNIARADMMDLRKRLEAAEKALEGMVRQFAYEGSKDGRPAYGTGGLSALEEAFSVLRWNDPQPALDRECQAAGCHKWASCGALTRDGYRWLCGDHYAALAGKPGHICGDPNSDCDVSCMDRAALAGEVDDPDRDWTPTDEGDK